VIKVTKRLINETAAASAAAISVACSVVDMAPPPTSVQYLMPMAEAKWIRVEIPKGRSMGLPGLASTCGWRTRQQGDAQFVCTEEKYFNRSARLVTPRRLVDKSNVADATAYQRFSSWPRQDAYGDLWTLAGPHVRERLEGEPSREDFWYALQVTMMAAPDSDVVNHLREVMEHVIVKQMPEASLWVLEVNSKLHSRFAAIRALFSVHEAPELLDRPREDFKGFLAARGLHPQVSFGFELFVEPALMFAAPWLFGIMSTRVGGLLIVMFGQPEPGRKETPAPELIDLYAPRGLTKVESTTEVQPAVSGNDAEAFLRWWAYRLNDLLGLALDPALFPDENGLYNPRAHFGFILTLERLFAVVQGILMHSRRDEYTRKVLFFDALDLLGGLGQGDYRALLSYRRVGERLDHMLGTLPSEVAKIVHPRLERGADALKEMRDGFYLSERTTPDALRVKVKSGQWTDLSMDRAVAEYLRVVRNSAHSFTRSMSNPFDLSLLASHDGELPAALPDVILVYITSLMANPQALFPRLR